MGISSLADCELRIITCRSVISNKNLQCFLLLRLSSTLTSAHRAASKTHLALSHTLVDVVGIANELACDSLYFQGCHFRHRHGEPSCVRISISLTCVFVSLQWATNRPLLNESKKRSARVKGKQCKEKGTVGVGAGAETKHVASLGT